MERVLYPLMSEEMETLKRLVSGVEGKCDRPSLVDFLSEACGIPRSLSRFYVDRFVNLPANVCDPAILDMFMEANANERTILQFVRRVNSATCFMTQLADVQAQIIETMNVLSDEAAKMRRIEQLKFDTEQREKAKAEMDRKIAEESKKDPRALVFEELTSALSRVTALFNTHKLDNDGRVVYAALKTVVSDVCFAGWDQIKG